MQKIQIAQHQKLVQKNATESINIKKMRATWNKNYKNSVYITLLCK